MGYTVHEAIVVTDHGYGDFIEHAHAVALARLGTLVGPIIEGAVNGVRSFVVVPDGSKEGWETAIEMERRRTSFLAYLETQRYGDGSCPLDWVCVHFGGDLETPATVAVDSRAMAVAP